MEQNEVYLRYKQEIELTKDMERQEVEFDNKKLYFLKMTSVDNGLTLNSIAYALDLSSSWLLRILKKNKDKFERTNNIEIYDLDKKEYLDYFNSKSTFLFYREGITNLALLTNSPKAIELAKLALEMTSIKNQDW